MSRELMKMGYKALKEQGVNEATSPPDQLRPNTPTPKPSRRDRVVNDGARRVGLGGDVFRSVPFGDGSLPPLNLARKGVPGTNFNQYAILPGVPTKSPKRPMREQSPEQKAFAGLLTPESAIDYLNQFPPVPPMRATYPKTVEGGSMLHPKYQHTQLPDLKPGDKGYMNRGMMMEMGYKALKEAMTGPFNKPDLPKLNNPMPQRPNPNTIRVPYDMDYIGPTKPPIFNKNTTSLTDAPPITNRDMMSGPRQQRPNIAPKRTAPSTGRSGRGIGRSPGSVKEAMTNPLADQNPLRNPAQSQDPNRGLGLITLRLR